MSDIRAKVYNRQNGEINFECSHDRYNRLCMNCVKEIEEVFNNLITSSVKKEISK